MFAYNPTAAEDFKTFDVKLELLEWKRALAGDALKGSADIVMCDFDIDELQP